MIQSYTCVKSEYVVYLHANLFVLIFTLFNQEGKEKDIVFSVMRRAFERENTANPLQVFSVFARDSLRGYIYLEAITQGAVQQALDGINNVFISKLRLVPIDEMVDTLTIKAKSGELKEKKWVRAKKGKYAGDLGQVCSTDACFAHSTCFL